MIREFVKSAIGMSWALSLLGMKRIGDLLLPGSSASSQPVAQQPDRSGSNDRRNRTRGAAARTPGLLNPGRLNTRSFVVIGEGLAAGMGDFALYDSTQKHSFPAQMARQMQTEFIQPLIQAPGLGGLAGFPEPPAVVPAVSQTTVFCDFPPARPCNLSVPAFTLHDSLHLRISKPMVQRHNAKQTALNLLCGVVPLAYGEQGELPSQLQSALLRSPTLCIVELGYFEVLEAAIHGGERLPAVSEFASHYERLVAELRAPGAEVIALAIPNPFDTAHFSSIETAARILRVDPSFLTSAYHLKPDDVLTLEALNEIGFQLFGRNIGTLRESTVLAADFVRQIATRVCELNTALTDVCRRQRAQFFDLHALFSKIATQGTQVGSRTLTGDYLGGFYSLNGYYPGATGHAVIANGILSLLNQNYGAEFSLLDPGQVMLNDPAARHAQATGSVWSPEKLKQFLAGTPAKASSPASAPQKSSQRPDRDAAEGETRPLRLPPNREQTLPLSHAASYFGDGIAAKNCTSERDMQYGSCGSLLFRGLAMVDSHLAGQLHFKFAAPKNDVTHFELSFPGGLVGDDAVLVAPCWFKMPFLQNRVNEVPGRISSGDLNLQTGEVSNLIVYAAYDSTALRALIGVNPNFPKQPMSFPGPYGSSRARFTQRADGKLDFTFYGSTFVPLGKGTRWPLNFFSPEMGFATVPADGTVMHPHLQLSTRDPEPPDPASRCPNLAYNSVRELTLFTHNSSFGDAFHLVAPELGGPAKGRSHVLGRVLMQVGEASGGSVPVAIFAAGPGGHLSPFPSSPLTQLFPGRLSPGPQGFNENLRFPQRSYPLDDLSIIDDPFEISMGALDVASGQFLNELLHRAFISQDLLFALLRVEPRTPKDSFSFVGPAWMEGGGCGEILFHYRGGLTLPYPSGFQFPNPDMTTSLSVGPHSRLDPFLWLRAGSSSRSSKLSRTARGEKVRASTGDEFSYHFCIPGEGEASTAVFEYENHTQQGKFHMHSLAWIDFAHSGKPSHHAEEDDTVTFTGFGVWSKDGVESVQQAAVQVSTSPDLPYVGIQIGGGDVSNVNTKPQDEQSALP
jgi:hypothetical protein